MRGTFEESSMLDFIDLVISHPLEIYRVTISTSDGVQLTISFLQAGISTKCRP